jgi:F-type H+-transporting ATPase subunit epsilon
MALPTFLAVNLVTPRGVIAHTDTDSLQAPGDLGEFELLPGHVPMLTALKAGVLTIGTKTRARYAVSTGYLRIDPQGSVEILVERAKPSNEVDAAAAQSRRPRPSSLNGVTNLRTATTRTWSRVLAGLTLRSTPSHTKGPKARARPASCDR